MRKIFVGVLLFFISTGMITAQTFTELADLNLVGTWNGSLEWADYDTDGDFDLLVSGYYTGVGDPITILYRNDGNDQFTASNLELFPAGAGDADWADFDADGDLDLALMGYDSDVRVTKVYRNDGDDNFTVMPADLAQVRTGAVSWGDYDQDGLPDLLLSGDLDTSNGVTKIYRNKDNETFLEVDAELIGLRSSSSTWGDFDGDGDLDILLCGYLGDFEHLTTIYENLGSGEFNQVDLGLTGVGYGSVSWGDYDNDGDLDILMLGRVIAGPPAVPLTTVYRNDNGVMVDLDPTQDVFVGLHRGNGEWVDFDGDGDLDIMIAGEDIEGLVYSQLYRNDGDDIFSEVDGGFMPFVRPAQAWADYDHDGDLDLAFSGRYASGDYRTKIYRHDSVNANTLPTPPVSLYAAMMGDAIELSWSPGADGETPATGLTYNVWVGSVPGQTDIVAPMAATLAGTRYIAGPGNAGLNDFFILRDLDEGYYYWRVQTIDTGLAGSEFSTEGIFQFDTGTVGLVETRSVDRLQLANYPNPFNPSTTVYYQIFTAGPVELSIYDLAGQLVKTLVDDYRTTGEYFVPWDGQNESGQRAASGVYHYRLITPAGELTRKMNLIK